MMQRLLPPLGLALLVGAGFAVVEHFDDKGAHPAAVAAGSVGAAAPPFRLPLVAGSKETEVSLATLQGRRSFLEFWASWCEACRDERPLLAKLRERNPKAAMVAIASMDAAPDVRRSESEAAHGYPVALDADGSLAHDFAVVGLPHSFVLDEQGRILRRYAGKLSDADVDEITALLR